MCEHLKKLEDYIKLKNIKETYRGQVWTENCREWVYFDCILDAEKLKEKLQLEPCVEIHDYMDVKAGTEFGLFCTVCKDAIIGFNPKHLPTGKLIID